MTSPLRHSWSTWAEGHVKSRRRLGTTHSGSRLFYISSLNVPLTNVVYRTLATDTGFKERVRDDMLVRLLDAFVWRSYGERDSDRYHRMSYRVTPLHQIDKNHTNWALLTCKA